MKATAMKGKTAARRKFSGFRLHPQLIERIEKIDRVWGMGKRAIVEKCLNLALPYLEKNLGSPIFNSEIEISIVEDSHDKRSDAIVETAVQQQLRRGIHNAGAGKRQSSQDAG